MSEKKFIVTNVGAKLDEFEEPTYLIFLPDEKLIENENVKSAFAKLVPLAHADSPQIELEVIDPKQLSSKTTELTCMDAREFSVASRSKLLDENFLTFAGSGFFLHPKISEKLRANGHSDLVDALTAIIDSAKEKGLKIDVLSNHFGEDGGCGGLNFFKTIDPNFEIPDAEAYRKLLAETCSIINEKFENIAENAKLVMYQTGIDGAIIDSFDLGDSERFAKFDENYEGIF